jgi:hypothetical protein
MFMFHTSCNAAFGGYGAVIVKEGNELEVDVNSFSFAVAMDLVGVTPYYSVLWQWTVEGMAPRSTSFSATCHPTTHILSNTAPTYTSGISSPNAPTWRAPTDQ